YGSEGTCRCYGVDG
ncbi:hypothetical protein A2U01_0111827, partial [Trifolium medium]|nr:hypothetical protein [Trifolium medium]